MYNTIGQTSSGMKITMCHPTANNFARALACALAKEDMLYEFYTTIASFPGDIWDIFQKIPFLAEIKRRNFNPILKSYTKTSPWLEIGRMISLKSGLTNLTRHESGLFCVDSVYKNLDRQVAAGLIKASERGIAGVYAYEDGALATFLGAQTLGLKCFYDLPIAYWETKRNLLAEEAARMPGWATTLAGGISDSQSKLERKTKELELADAVIVPSGFVKTSLPVWAQNKKIIVSPFGSPAIKTTSSHPEANEQDKPLRVLFAGSMGQRKGLGDLFAAMKLLNRRDIELVVMGSLQAPMDFYRREYADFTYEPGRPNEQVLELMRSCDVFCLPSIVEGRALVMQEAMSQGLPLIITPNTGGEDLIVEGETGFLVPIRSPEAIAEKINWFLDNRPAIAAMGEAARQHAEKISWDSYADRIIEALRVFLT